jgi:uncharacterized membrane protein
MAATLTTGILAGFYCGWSTSVMPGLNRVTPRAAIEGFQGMNAAIIHPVFMVSFLGAPFLAAGAAALLLGKDHRALLWWVGAAALLNVVGLITTGVFNIPLNDHIDGLGVPASIADPAKEWSDFYGSWMLWHNIRTVAHTVAFGLLSWALILLGRKTI